MTGNPYDQASRFLAKGDPEGVFLWLLGVLPPASASSAGRTPAGCTSPASRTATATPSLT
jgi:hypothetical protein